jgi:beta-lactamase class A
VLLLQRIGAVSAISAVIAIGGACGPFGATLAPPSPPSATVDAAPFAAAIRQLTGVFDGTASIVIAFPGVADPLYAAGADTPYIAASLYKLAVLLRVEGLVDRGPLTYDDTITIEDVDVTVDGSNEPAGTRLTIDEALEEMITYSDNGSALALLRVYGAPATNAALAAAGIKGFRIAENSDQDHMVTARALGTYFDLLATRRLVSPAASDRMLARLARQTINDRLPRDLPTDVTVAHKTGDLIGLIHDAGVIQAPDGPRIAVVLTSGGSEPAARDLIARIGTTVYSAVLARPAGARADALPESPGTRASGIVGPAGGAALVALAIGVFVVGWLAATRNRERRGPVPGPMTVWSPDRKRRRDR